ncbi:MAG TPA: YafY family protein [Polyangiaceae bacterium]|nr:YafY family protein [Polyangiaceae bacterium]
MLQTSARLLRLVTLLQSRRFWTGQALCDSLEVTDRTLRRDVNRVRSLGYPVLATSGVAGGYQLGAGASLPPLQLDDDEALAVSLALATVATGSVGGIEDAALRALGKLEQVLPVRLRKRASTLRAAIVPLQRSNALADANLLSVLASASREHFEVEFSYADGKRQSSERHVQPMGLVHTGYRWYLVGWDLLRDDYRTFRADRIEGLPRTGAQFAPRPLPLGGDLKAYVQKAISTNNYDIQASIVLYASASAMRETILPATGLVEPLGPKRCRLSVGTSSLDYLAHRLLSLDVDFEVEKPTELIKYFEKLQARLGRTLEIQPKRKRVK